MIEHGCQHCLTPICFTVRIRSMAEQVVAADEKEQNEADGEDAVCDKQHQNHSECYPKQDKTNKSLHFCIPFFFGYLYYMKQKKKISRNSSIFYWKKVYYI